MSNPNNIEQKLKERFENYAPAPPEAVWKNIASEINRPAAFYTTKWFYSAVAAAVIAALLFVYFNSDNTSQPTITREAPIENQNMESPAPENVENIEEPTESVVDDVQADLNNTVTEVNAENESKPPLNQKEIPTPPPEKENPIITDQHTQKDIQELEVEIADSDKLQKEVTEDTDEQELVNVEEIIPIGNDIVAPTEDINKSESEKDADKEPAKEENTIVLENVMTRPLKEYKSPAFILGAYAGPDLTIYPNKETDNKQSFNFGISGTYNFSFYMIRSGLSVSLSEDSGERMISYERYEFLGTYDYVDSLTFDDEGNPTYHTSTMNVFDSIREIQRNNANNKYIYLNIPLHFGIQKEYRKWAVSLSTGPTLSVLIDENIQDIDIQVPNSNVLSVDEDLPKRIRTNWRWMTNLDVAYKINETFRLFVQPSFGYWMKSAYDISNNNKQNPYTIGGQGGLLIGLNSPNRHKRTLK
jgi:hypothetical protein